MGYMFNHDPFVDDRLRQLLKEEVMNLHQLTIPTTTITITNGSAFGTQAMNPIIAHTTIFINYQTT
jgi:hypothetical protein